MLFSLQSLVNRSPAAIEADANEIIALNPTTEAFGLTLTQKEAHEIAEIRAGSLKENGRLEVGIGALSLISDVFAHSRYVSCGIWAEVLARVCDLFYQVKSLTNDSITDRELVTELYALFEYSAHGDLDYFEQHNILTLLRKLNFGYTLKQKNEALLEDRIGRMGQISDTERDAVTYDVYLPDEENRRDFDEDFFDDAYWNRDTF